MKMVGTDGLIAVQFATIAAANDYCGNDADMPSLLLPRTQTLH
jgi:hypothetical protein